MCDRKARLVRVFVILLVGLAARAQAQDCNKNGIRDEEDLIPEDFGFGDHATFPALKGVIAVESRDFQGNPIDLNGDGFIDLVVANRSSSEVSVLLNLGDGSFDEPINWKVGAFPQSLTIADFNGDGYLDVATANTLGESVSVLLSENGWRFAKAIAYDTGYWAKAITAGDFDGDGDPDLAVTLWNGPSRRRLQILINNQGQFDFGFATRLGPGSPTFIASGDINGDRIQDLVVTLANMTPGRIVVFMGLGDGTFAPRVRYEMGPVHVHHSPTGLVIADLDGDSDMDIAVSNWWDDRWGWGDLRIFENLGDGTFREPLVFFAFGFAESIVLGDFDFDGDLDVALANNGEQTLSVMFNQGFLNFSAPVHFFVGPIPRSITTADFDGDGLLDLAAAKVDYDDEISILFGQTTGPAFSNDCNRNDIPDECEIADGSSEDCNDNGTLDECELFCEFVRWPENCRRNDCNGNEVPDQCDLADGTSDDYNNNNLPDECDPCFGDFNRNGERDEIDLLVLQGVFGCRVGLGNWPCDEADIDGDGQVNPVDLGLLQALMGPCPDSEKP